MAFRNRAQLKMSEETFDFVCTNCAEDNKVFEAVKYCVQCGGYCCQSCTKAHKKFPSLKVHTLMDITERSQATRHQPNVTEFPTERCGIHAGKIVDMYCEDHDVVGCSVCFAKDHKSCKDSHIHYVPDVIDTIFKLSDCKQIHILLKDMMISMEGLSKSNKNQLEILNKAKEAALDKVRVFHKALKAILGRITKATESEVVATYKELEKEILTRGRTVETIHDDLRTLDGKLQRSEGNRSQQFVCSKLAHQKTKGANNVKDRQELEQNIDVQLSFIPDQSLVECLTDFQCIGQVQKHVKIKDALYKIKNSTDITIKLSDDYHDCYDVGCCLTSDNQLIVSDYHNMKLKRVDIQNMSVVDACTLNSPPGGVCCVSKHEVAVACTSTCTIQFVSILKKMTPTRQIKLSHWYYDVACKDDMLYVTDGSSSLYVYSMAGALLETIAHDSAGNKLFTACKHVSFTDDGKRMFVGDGECEIVCLDGKGTYLSRFKDVRNLKFVDGVCVDSRGNVFAVGNKSNTVAQFDEYGKKLGVVVTGKDGLVRPQAISFHPGLNRMFVTMQGYNAVKMYELA